MIAGRDEFLVYGERLEGSRFYPLSNRPQDRAKNRGITQRTVAGGSRERFHA
jgi:hypothetical protein